MHKSEVKQDAREGIIIRQLPGTYGSSALRVRSLIHLVIRDVRIRYEASAERYYLVPRFYMPLLIVSKKVHE